MLSSTQQNNFDIVEFSDEENDEGFAQLPISSEFKSTGSQSNCGAIVWRESADSCSTSLTFEVPKSLEFKKPTNLSLSKTPSSNSDADTQCDSTESDSEDEIFTMTEKDLKISMENYEIIVERSHALVRDAIESKFRGLRACALLKRKLFEIFAEKEVAQNPDLFFTEYNFTSEETIVNGERLDLNEVSKESFKTLKPQMKMRHRLQRNLLKRVSSS